MRRILLIEQSATRRHALARQFPRDSFDTQVIATYEEALTRLKDPEAQFDAIVLGWPEQAAAITDELLALLGQEAYRRLAVVVLSDSHESAQVNWITERPGTALLLWEEHREIREVLARVWRRLPQSEEIDTTVPGESGDTRGIRILLVDDSPTARYTYRQLLTNNGYEVTTADSVDETGDVLCQRLRQDPRTYHITVSVLTGTYVDHVIADNLAAGAVECMFKNEADELFLARVAAMSRSIRARRSVERERRYLEGILSSVGDGVFGVDNAGRLSFMNPVARTILDFHPSDDIIGREARALFHYADAYGRPCTPEDCFLSQAYLSGERLTNWQTYFWTRKRQPVPVEGTLYPLTIDGERYGSVVAFRDITERRLLEDQLRWQANHDALTRLLNRHYFEQSLHHEFQRIARSGGTSALVFVDLDQFKYINDTAGHAGGDQLLLEVSRRLSTRLRGSDILARLGGDEFALLLHDVDASRIAQAG
ncbi:MAG: two-component system response regulator, partial [Proteobacteria bacterium SW_6_67_9]